MGNDYILELDTLKILIISYFYSPTLNPRTIRWSNIAEYWVSQGYHVDVICVRGPGLSPDERLGGVHVYRVGGWFVEKLRNRFNKVRNGFQLTVSPDRGTNGNISSSFNPFYQRLQKGVQWLHDCTWKKLYWPDHACMWFFPATKLARKLIPTQQYDALITVSYPFTGHLIGLGLKKHFSDLKWVADSGDPFSFMDEVKINNWRLYRRLNHFIEGRVFNKTDYVSVTTKETAKMYEETFPSCGSIIKIIPPILSIYSDTLLKDKGLFAKGKITLVFVGSLYKKIREPDVLLEILDRAFIEDPFLKDEVEMHFFGDAGSCAGSFNEVNETKDVCKMHGIVPRNVAIKAIMEADFLINLGNSTSYQLPSKLVEYISTGKPIINIFTSDEDSSVKFLEKYPIALNIGGSDSSGSAKALVEFIKCYRGKVVPPDTVKQFIRFYKVDEIAKCYLNLVLG